jgi:hypothetical protein
MSHVWVCPKEIQRMTENQGMAENQGMNIDRSLQFELKSETNSSKIPNYNR